MHSQIVSAMLTTALLSTTFVTAAPVLDASTARLATRSQASNTGHVETNGGIFNSWKVDIPNPFGGGDGCGAIFGRITAQGSGVDCKPSLTTCDAATDGTTHVEFDTDILCTVANMQEGLMESTNRATNFTPLQCCDLFGDNCGVPKSGSCP